MCKNWYHAHIYTNTYISSENCLRKYNLVCHKGLGSFFTEMLLVITRSVHCFTISRVDGMKATLGNKDGSNLPYSRINTESRTDAIRKTGNVIEENEQEEKLKQSELGSQIQEKDKR